MENYGEIGEAICKSLFVLSKSLIQQEVIQHHFIKTLEKSNKIGPYSPPTNSYLNKLQQIKKKTANDAKTLKQGKGLKTKSSKKKVVIKNKRKTIFQATQKFKKQETSSIHQSNNISTGSKDAGQGLVKLSGHPVKQRNSTSNLKNKQSVESRENKSGSNRKPNTQKETDSSDKFPSLQHKESGIDYLSGIEQLSDILSKTKEPQYNLNNLSIKSDNYLSESESASFSSGLSTDEEEEYLNNIIDAIDK